MPRLFVGNIPYATSEEGLRAFFEERAGKVESARVITDFDSLRSKGYAFIEMASPADADRAIKELNNAILDGRRIVVKEARSPAADRPRSGGRRPRP